MIKLGIRFDELLTQRVQTFEVHAQYSKIDRKEHIELGGLGSGRAPYNIGNCDALATLKYAMDIEMNFDLDVSNANGDGVGNSLEALMMLRYGKDLI